jgi:hypothetical protein
MLHSIHQNDRQRMAESLGLSLKEFDRLVASGNAAYEILTKLGPFYGKEHIQEPTFRTTAEAFRLPDGSKKQLTDLGNDLWHLAKALQSLPEEYKQKIGTGIRYEVPLTWRIDAIIDKDHNIRVNEIEGIDSVSALLMAEQLAFKLQKPSETTVAQFIAVLKKMFPQKYTSKPLLIAIVRTALATNPFTPNARRFIEFLHKMSNDTIDCHLYDIDELKGGIVKPNWDNYTAVINEAYISPKGLEALGIATEKLLNAGNYNALVNKGVFALVHTPALREFWSKELGEERFERLKKMLIKSELITNAKELSAARKAGKVCKVSWSEHDIIVVNRAKGIAMPDGEIMESEDARWEELEKYMQRGDTVIAQEFVEPARLFALLRKRDITLEPVNWYNRLCVKYVCQSAPNGQVAPTVALTAAEITLGPEVIPAGRKCAFTAAKLV